MVRVKLEKKVIVVLNIAILLIFITGCSDFEKKNHWTQSSLIAHAAGGINGLEYTNSLEAFHRSHENVLCKGNSSFLYRFYRAC